MRGCPNCGARLLPESSETVRCPNCGKKVKDPDTVRKEEVIELLIQGVGLVVSIILLGISLAGWISVPYYIFLIPMVGSVLWYFYCYAVDFSVERHPSAQSSVPHKTLTKDKKELVDAEDWNEEGARVYNYGDHKGALKCYDKAIEINPEYALAWNNKGEVLFRLDKNEEAMKCYDKAIEINPEYALAWNNKGRLLYRLGKYEEAVKCYDNATKINIGGKSAWEGKAKALEKLGRYEEAAKCKAWY